MSIVVPLLKKISLGALGESDNPDGSGCKSSI